MGMMSEHGPYTIENGKRTFVKNDYSWNRETNILYVESPAGVGFSTCGNEDECTHDDESSSIDNLAFLINWYN